MSGPQAGERPLDLASRWVLESGIQSPCGGFHAWFDLGAGRYSFLYPEITGYGITALIFLSGLRRDRSIIERAMRAGEWILSAALHPCGGVRTRLYGEDETPDPFYSFSSGNIFSFDTAMVLYGMVHLAQATGDGRFLDASVAMGRFLTGTMQAGNGALLPLFNPKTGAAATLNDGKWSNQAGGFLAKASLGLIALSEATGDRSYRDAVVELCDHALTTQDPSGRFITDRASGTTHLHPHCYAAEGLLWAGTALDIPRYVDASRRATRWIFSLTAAGQINELYSPSTGRFNAVMRSDILAQALRLGTVFSCDGGLAALREELGAHQYRGVETVQRGGFLYTRGGQHVNSWCTMFALQALALAWKDSAPLALLI
ncbi:MAG: hypothetical protein IT574_05230 [Candidatus Aureabacteria bacterium]|jgi:uncharacterized protein YyaL (SSP411 family)|nr:hypothetical protein [Candidatus Auribacterota bacterium]